MKLVYNEETKQVETPQNNNDNKHTLQGNNVSEESKDQRAKMKDKPLKEKIAYYVGYYKFHALAVVIIAAVLISIVYTMATAKDYCYYGMLINANGIDREKLQTAFAEYANFDTEEYECYIDSESRLTIDGMGQEDVSTSTKLAASLQARELDGLVFDSVNFVNYAMNQCFLDLSTVLSPEEMSLYEGKIYYIDMKEALRLEEDVFAENPITDKSQYNTLEKMQEELEKHLDPSALADPVPVGIVIDESPFIVGTDAYHSMIPVFAIAGNTTKIEESLKFLDFMFESEYDYKQLLYFW